MTSCEELSLTVVAVLLVAMSVYYVLQVVADKVARGDPPTTSTPKTKK